MAPCSPRIPSPTWLLGMTDDELAAFEAHIIAVCAEHRGRHWRDFDYRACVTVESKKLKYFIKFDIPRTLWPEFSTQSYIYDCAKSLCNGPRVPQALHYFENQGKAYLVMEHIWLRDESPPDLVEKTAEALNWLSEVPPPSEDLIGPIGGGLIHHRFFKDNRAPLAFSSVGALERYMNKGRKLLPGLATEVKPIVITNDPLIFTQSDMHVSNFGVDQCGNMVLFDFGDIGRLPLSFAKYTMGSHGNGSFIARVANLLRWPNLDNSNMFSMASVSSYLWMKANPALGLDEDGWPQSKKVKPQT
ncbi:hypothetical protein E1B28_005893 [Marasmius oreades]|uniref:Aminoglycoside phosphotransferase domain-containing protein n=1 Tax=Marasmius oreades TaxID=181124 RepID=A0A9P7S4L5_9AGAR|nr:uncharacterized protein E1B28_005893 [Marasmius oreades]KAG7095108.1 hypothetical protein E1B28_005893 [Marasmius oreades]